MLTWYDKLETRKAENAKRRAIKEAEEAEAIKAGKLDKRQYVWDTKARRDVITAVSEAINKAMDLHADGLLIGSHNPAWYDKLSSYEKKEVHRTRNTIIPGTKLTRAYCHGCGEPMRMGSGFDAYNERCWCEVCDPRASGCSSPPSPTKDDEEYVGDVRPRERLKQFYVG